MNTFEVQCFWGENHIFWGIDRGIGERAPGFLILHHERRNVNHVTTFTLFVLFFSLFLSLFFCIALASPPPFLLCFLQRSVSSLEATGGSRGGASGELFWKGNKNTLCRNIRGGVWQSLGGLRHRVFFKKKPICLFFLPQAMTRNTSQKSKRSIAAKIGRFFRDSFWYIQSYKKQFGKIVCSSIFVRVGLTCVLPPDPESVVPSFAVAVVPSS